jgi:hypothetical protein
MGNAQGAKASKATVADIFAMELHQCGHSFNKMVQYLVRQIIFSAENYKNSKKNSLIFSLLGLGL